ncbi:MAG: penicillin-binding protein 2 [Aquificaceae bacterium]|nr:MAG: penicillin-binding protein 2 [Aquificaceae bacterium]
MRKARTSNKLPPVYRGRRFALLSVLLFLIGVLLLRAGYLEVFQQQWLQKQADKRQMREVIVPPYRGMIVDRNEESLAISSPVESVWCNPRKLFKVRNGLIEGTKSLDEDASLLAKVRLDEIDVGLQQLATLLRIDFSKLQQKLQKSKSKQFIYLARQIPPELSEDIANLNLPSISSTSEYRRFYPMGEALSHVIGFTNIDDKGVEGIERSMNQLLAGASGKKRVVRDGKGRLIENIEQVKEMVSGQEVALSIDKRIQFQAYKELKNQVYQVNAKAGSVVVLDIYTGEILAMANMPGFNPNVRADLKPYKYRNRAVMDTFEPGSTMKPLTIAAALEDRAIGADVMIDTSPGYIDMGKTVIRDPINYGSITLDKILAKSSNVGASKVALLMKPSGQWKFLSRVGIGRRPNAGFPSEAQGKLTYYDKWGRVDRASLGYGYGASVSLLQMAHAYSVFGTGGVLYPTSIIKRKDKVSGQRVMKEKNAHAVLRMMRAVVQKRATGKRAKIDGYHVAGKTGTAYKFINKRYRKDKKIVSFIGLAPASNPRLVVAVMVNEPRVEHVSGGRIAAPIFAKVMASALRILDIPPDNLPAEKLARWVVKGGSS